MDNERNIGTTFNLDVSFSGINGIWYTSSLEPPITSADVSKAATNAITSSGVSTFDPYNDSVYVASDGLDYVNLSQASDPNNPTTLIELIYQTWLDMNDVPTVPSVPGM